MNSDFKDKNRCSSYSRVGELHASHPRFGAVRRALLGTALIVQGSVVLADSGTVPPWVNSYAADGQCFCAPELPAEYKRKVLPTPVGGQSVAQVCQRIGPGPALTLTGNTFNYPVYADPQCGHGPANHGLTDDIAVCDGQMTIDAQDCIGVGPEWDLVSAYSRPAPASKEDSTNVASVVNTAATTATPTSAEAEVASVAAPDVKEEADEPIRFATVVKTEVIKPAPIKPAPVSDRAFTSDAEGSLPLATVVSEKPLKSKESTVQARTSVATPPKALVSEPVIVKRDVVDTASITPEPETPQVATVDPLDSPDLTEDPLVAEAAEANESPVADDSISALAEGASENTAIQRSDASEEAVALVAESQSEEITSVEPATAARVATPLDRSLNQRGFISLIPVNYDFGGAGLAVGGGLSVVDNWMLTARAAAANTYSEARIGIERQQQLASLPVDFFLAAGFEHGRFDWTDAEHDDSGVFASGALGYQFAPALTGAAGLNISTFFEGDPSLFGQLAWRVSKALSVTGQAELGDNDNVGVGVMFNY